MTYTLIYLGLVALVALTTVIAFMDLGRFNVLVAMTIAVTKAMLVILFFMHVRTGPRVTWVFAAAGFFWLGILFVLTMNDVLTRGWIMVKGGFP